MERSINLSLLLFFILIFFYFTGIILYHVNRKSQLHQLFVLISMILSLWMLNLSAFFYTDSIELLKNIYLIMKFSEIIVYPLIVHFILNIIQNKKRLWLYLNYLPMGLALSFYGAIFLNSSIGTVPMESNVLYSQFSIFYNQIILGIYSIIYSLIIFSLYEKNNIPKEIPNFKKIIQRGIGWIFLGNTFFLLFRILLNEEYFILFTTATPIIIGIPYVLTAYILLKYEKKIKVKSILSNSFGLMDDEAKDRAYLYLSLGLIYMAYLSYAIEYFVTGSSFYVALRPGITLFIIGHLLYFIGISYLSSTVKEWIITLLMAFATLFILVYFQTSYAQIAGLGISLIMILFTILFSNLNRLLFLAITSLGSFIYLWAKYPQIQYTIKFVDHISRIILLLIFSIVAVYIHYILKKRWTDYNHNTKILQLNSDLAHIILNKQTYEPESLTNELLTKWIEFSGAETTYLYVELEPEKPQEYVYSKKSDLKQSHQKENSKCLWEKTKEDFKFTFNKPYNKIGSFSSAENYSFKRIEYLPLKYEEEVKGFLLSFYEQDKIEYEAFQLVLSDVLSYHLEEVSQKLILEEKLHQLAFYDQLTGLPNRVKFEDVFLRFIQNNKEENKKCALFVIDLNNFKKINDQYGHQIGDELLRLYAGRLRRTIREEDWISRYGGDEFLVFIPKVESIEKAEEIKKRLQAIDQKAYRLNTKISAITQASIGMSLFPEDGKNLSQLMNVADQRMYKEKFVSKHNK